MSGRRERTTNELEGKPGECSVSKPSQVFPEVEGEPLSNATEIYNYVINEI